MQTKVCRREENHQEPEERSSQGSDPLPVPAHKNSHTRVTSARRSHSEGQRGAQHHRKLGWKLQAWTEKEWKERQGQEEEKDVVKID